MSKTDLLIGHVAGKRFTLPIDAVTQAFGILAKRRAGKSYAARKFAEQLHRGGQQIVIVDPKGDWWGIRYAADGKRPGLPVIILGGEHADVPLEVNGGEIVAKLIVEERVSVLLDISLFRKKEVAVFMTAFMETLYRLKAQEKYRTPVMLLLDEADAIAPQKPFAGEERMLGAAEDIVRRGGQRGIGCTMISQRSAVINKNLLTQIQVLVALRTISPQDLAALNAWVDVHGTPEERKVLIESLPSLPVGTAWFWSPGWPTNDGVFAQVKVDAIETFDSGASPKPGEKRIEPKSPAEIDLDALRRQMSSTIEKAEKTDPKKLQARIAELERQIRTTKPAPAAVDTKAIERAITAAEAQRDRHWRGEVAVIKRSYDGAVGRLNKIAQLAHVNGDAARPIAEPPKTVSPPATPVPIARPLPTAPPRETIHEAMAAEPDEIKINATMRRVLAVLLNRQRMGQESTDKRTAAALVGVKKGGGTFGTYLSRMRTAGLITGSSEAMKITAAGEAEAGDIDELPRGQGLIDHYKRTKLNARQAQILDLILERGEIHVDQIAETLGIKPEGGTFGTYLSRMRSLGLIEGSGIVRPTKAFLEGIRG